MKWNCRKWTAFTLAMAIVMTSPMLVSAEMEEESKTGSGRVEGIVNTDVYQVVLPTVSNHSFDFIIDPQKLINQTEGAGYGGKTFEKNATLFFRRTDSGKKEDYSSISNPITIINRGSKSINVSLNVSMSPSSLEGIRMTKDIEFRGDNSASLYMAVTDGENIMPVGTDGININTTLEAAPKEAFEYGYNIEKARYTYTLKKNLDSSIFSTRSFRITGAANGKGDWSKLKEASPKIMISWKISEKKDVLP